ncbi:hypothetical protein FV141_14340 (plasmid) [Dermacoccus abyssi]|uniref:Uncharacterized protein n=1 Tax=Dermacoccus abyssi TaxID=322596 RepID=A0ABX5ZD47_9MICO|nr:hypothetical protein FV141_14340 [Dermacoccus abyssi]
MKANSLKRKYGQSREASATSPLTNACKALAIIPSPALPAPWAMLWPITMEIAMSVGTKMSASIQRSAVQYQRANFSCTRPAATMGECGSENLHRRETDDHLGEQSEGEGDGVEQDDDEQADPGEAVEGLLPEVCFLAEPRPPFRPVARFDDPCRGERS